MPRADPTRYATVDDRIRSLIRDRRYWKDRDPGLLDHVTRQWARAYPGVSVHTGFKRPEPRPAIGPEEVEPWPLRDEKPEIQKLPARPGDHPTHPRPAVVAPGWTWNGRTGAWEPMTPEEAAAQEARLRLRPLEAERSGEAPGAEAPGADGPSPGSESGLGRNSRAVGVEALVSPKGLGGGKEVGERAAPPGVQTAYAPNHSPDGRGRGVPGQQPPLQGGAGGGGMIGPNLIDKLIDALRGEPSENGSTAPGAVPPSTAPQTPTPPDPLETRRKDSSKNEKHGDSGREKPSVDQQIENLEARAAGAQTKKEREALRRKIRKIKETRARQRRGEEHSRRPKR